MFYALPGADIEDEGPIKREVFPMEDGELTPKQKRFCEEYLVDLNATQAAIRAGYRKTSAYSTACDNLKKSRVTKYIRLLTVLRSLRTQSSADRVLEELAKVAFAKEGVKI